MQSEPGKSAYLSLFSGTDLYVYLVSIHTSSPMKQNASTGSQPKSGKRNRGGGFCQENPRSEKSMQQTEEQRNLICDKLLLTAIAYLCGENHNQRQYNNDS